MYTEKVLIQLQTSQLELSHKLSSLIEKLLALATPKLKNSHAKEYLQHGLCRRLKLINKTIKNIYEIFPPDRTKKLSMDELDNAQINLHAFSINTYGALDNIAWIYALENQFTDLLENPIKIGLFRKELKTKLPQELKDYINNPTINRWFNDYAKNYRDALAHRIPLYIPPLSLNPAEVSRYTELEDQKLTAIKNLEFELLQALEAEQERLGSISHTYLHSFAHDKSRPVALHPQILADGFTILEISDRFSKVL